MNPNKLVQQVVNVSHSPVTVHFPVHVTVLPVNHFQQQDDRRLADHRNRRNRKTN